MPALGYAYIILGKIMPHRTEMTPFGFISMSSNGKAITNLTWVTTDTPQIDHDPILDQAFQELHEYAKGERQQFSVPVDLEDISALHQDWLQVLRQVGYGETISYQELASRAGKPKAARAAGSACARNPVPIIYPCHRILKSDGDLGNFGAIRQLKPDDGRNLKIKAKLIEHEKIYWSNDAITHANAITDVTMR